MMNLSLFILVAVLVALAIILRRYLRRLRSELLASRRIVDDMTQKHWAFLIESNRGLTDSLDYESTLLKVAELAVPGMADCCWLEVVEEKGKVRRIAKGVAISAGLLRRSALVELTRLRDSTLFANVTESELPLLVSEPEDVEIFKASGIKSVIVLPLDGSRGNIGAIAFAVRASGRRYGDNDLNALRRITARAVLAIDNSRLYKRAQEAVFARDHMVAVVSHDLKNPLAAIQLQTELLIRQPEPISERAQKQLLLIKSSAERMSRLIEDLLDFRKVETGHFRLQSSEVSMTVLLDEALRPLSLIASQKGIGIELESLSEDVRLRVDGDRIHQVITNVVGNALKFTDSGEIKVRVTNGDSEFLISVLDSGPGIEPDYLPKIFDPYWQSQKTAKSGSGLGLAISRAIIEKHGGRIWAENRPGGGVAVHFTIPKRETGDN